MKNKKSGLGIISIIILLLGALFLGNPSTQDLRELIRSQKQLKLTLASHLPIERTNYLLGSKFEIKYGLGSTICYGTLKVIIICPSKKGLAKISDEANDPKSDK